MKLYDDVILLWKECLSTAPIKHLKTQGPFWKDAGTNNMVFQRDMAFALGGDRRFETSAFAVTENADLVAEDEILLIGPDIPEIKEDRPFSRLTIVRVKPGSLPEDDGLFMAIQKIGFTKYHVNPEGYMLRISSGNGVESVRVSKSAVQKGLTFAKVGSLYNKAYHQHPSVEAVKTVFITDDAFDFETLKTVIRKAEDITRAIDHIYQKMSLMDCGACSLQTVCNEVEGLRELHFKQNA